MFKISKPLFLVCETPLHAGSGSDLGIVDLPIQRERHTGFPKVESSGIKGSVRDSFERKLSNNEIGNNTYKDYEEAISLVFGPEHSGDHAGAIGFTDARLLLFPVKSMKGVFAWVTSPKVIERFFHDMKMANINFDFKLPKSSSTPKDSELFVKGENIVLEEYTFLIKNKDDENTSKFAEWLSNLLIPQGEEYEYLKNKLKRNIVVLEDDDFSDFVNLSTEVITRIEINSITGTVKNGALFTEEYLPAESILYTLVMVGPIFNTKKGIFKPGNKKEEELVSDFFLSELPSVIQLGGNATIGKGIIRTKVLEVE